jgi:hypothetical protein
MRRERERERGREGLNKECIQACCTGFDAGWIGKGVGVGERALNMVGGRCMVRVRG